MPKILACLLVVALVILASPSLAQEEEWRQEGWGVISKEEVTCVEGVPFFVRTVWKGYGVSTAIYPLPYDLTICQPTSKEEEE